MDIEDRGKGCEFEENLSQCRLCTVLTRWELLVLISTMN